MTSTPFDALQGVASATTLLVALDFDGTLAPTVDDPAAARALPGATDAIESLSRSAGTVVAIVSGRSLSSLREVLAVSEKVVLVGSHGAESYLDGEAAGPVLTQGEHELLEAVCLVVETTADRFPGARLERKPSGCALHTRLATVGDAEAARHDAVASVEALENSALVVQRYGKDILEFLIRPADKGGALRWLRELFSATAVVFLGDDVTDEDGFRALTPGDVGVKVGEGETVAEFRVADPTEAVRLLAALAVARDSPLNGARTSRTP